MICPECVQKADPFAPPMIVVAVRVERAVHTQFDALVLTYRCNACKCRLDQYQFFKLIKPPV